MLALTDEQLAMVTTAASMLAVDDRNQFLRSMAAQLTSRPPTDGDLAAAISFVLQGREVSVHPAMFLHEPEPRRRGAYNRRRRA
jgi:hypothetical protein